MATFTIQKPNWLTLEESTLTINNTPYKIINVSNSGTTASFKIYETSLGLSIEMSKWSSSIPLKLTFSNTASDVSINDVNPTNGKYVLDVSMNSDKVSFTIKDSYKASKTLNTLTLPKITEGWELKASLSMVGNLKIQIL